MANSEVLYSTFMYSELSQEAQQKANDEVKRALMEIISDDEALKRLIEELKAKFTKDGALVELVDSRFGMLVEENL